MSSIHGPLRTEENEHKPSLLGTNVTFSSIPPAACPATLGLMTSHIEEEDRYAHLIPKQEVMSLRSLTS